MKKFFLLILFVASYLSTQQVKHYYTQFFKKTQNAFKPVARVQFLNCMKNARQKNTGDLFDTRDYDNRVMRCKSKYNKKMSMNDENRKLI